MLIPAGILTDPFFDRQSPSYMNFGALGCIVAHEITHGFDIRGSLFDHLGNNHPWWTPQTQANYQARAQCFVDQYSSFVVPELNKRVNGLMTLAENIADNGGAKVAFDAYKAHVRQHGELGPLPGLEHLTSDHLFWLSFANIWCGKYRPEFMVTRIENDYHSPPSFRVN